jgi:UDP-N-acetylglucosamine 3-dehydrogenase
MIGHIERFNPAVSKLKEIIDEGIVGDLITLSSRRVGPFVERVTDVGIIVDIGTHDIDIARYVVGTEPVETFCKLRGIKHRKGDCAFIILEFEKVTASIELNWFTPHRVRSLVVTGTKGIAYADYSEQSVTIYNSGWKMEPKIRKEEPLRLELSHFLHCVETGEKPLISGEEGLKTLEIALNVEKKK